jgi:FKBP-type peptidyl-prolyl cis-trans isomerase FklB
VIQKEKLEMSIQEAQAIINDYFQQLQEKAYEQNIKEGKNFLVENAKRAEVKTTVSGLQYEIIKEGKGQKPAASDRVKVHYHGTLINGNVFDSSVNRGEPATFGVTQVIQGWVEALQLMPVGSKWKLYIPSELAYGAQGAGQSIAPHTTLIFEVELLDIV